MLDIDIAARENNATEHDNKAAAARERGDLVSSEHHERIAARERKIAARERKHRLDIMARKTRIEFR